MKNVMPSTIFFKWTLIITTIICPNSLQKLSCFPLNLSMKFLESLKNLTFGLQCLSPYFLVSIIYESDKIRHTTKSLDFCRIKHHNTPIPKHLIFFVIIFYEMIVYVANQLNNQQNDLNYL